MLKFTKDEETMLALLAYPDPKGLHPNELRWRILARKLKINQIRFNAYISDTCEKLLLDINKINNNL